jgi:hypothetical protein
MTPRGISIALAVVAGIAAVFALPPSWLTPLSELAAVCGVVSALIARVSTKTAAPSNPGAEAALFLANLPEEPLAPVKPGWALSIFLTSAAFLISAGLTIIARANA